MSLSKIPVVDLQNFPVEFKGSFDLNLKDPQIQRLIAELDGVLRASGGCYFRGHGISPEVISNVFGKSKEFFKLPASVKGLYGKDFADRLNSYGGYYVSKNESFRERFDVLNSPTGNRFPDAHAPGFQDAVEMYRADANRLVDFVLTLVAGALKPEDPDFFVARHQGALFPGSKSESKAHLSSLFYHNIEVAGNQDEFLMKKHTDFTTVTILTSSARGLQVEVTDSDGGKEWIDADPKEGCVLLNVGDQLERWTGGHYMATVHRVRKMAYEDSEGRQSMPYFVHPDMDTIVEPIVTSLNNGKDYSPIRAVDYWNQKMTKRPMSLYEADLGDKTPETA